MPPGRPLSDLVRDSKIDTEMLGTCTRHIFYVPDRSARERRIRREEEWVRESFLSQGAYGTVYKKRCEREGRGSICRAVKEIRKRIASEELDYVRELKAIVKFSHPKVRPGPE